MTQMETFRALNNALNRAILRVLDCWDSRDEEARRQAIADLEEAQRRADFERLYGIDLDNG